MSESSDKSNAAKISLIGVIIQGVIITGVLGIVDIHNSKQMQAKQIESTRAIEVMKNASAQQANQLQESIAKENLKYRQTLLKFQNVRETQALIEKIVYQKSEDDEKYASYYKGMILRSALDTGLINYYDAMVMYTDASLNNGDDLYNGIRWFADEITPYFVYYSAKYIIPGNLHKDNKDDKYRNDRFLISNALQRYVIAQNDNHLVLKYKDEYKELLGISEEDYDKGLENLGFDKNGDQKKVFFKDVERDPKTGVPVKDKPITFYDRDVP